MTISEIVVSAIRHRSVLLENSQFIRTAPTGTVQSLNAKLRHLRTSLAEAETAERGAEQASNEIEARRDAMRAEKIELAAQIADDDRAVAQGVISLDEAAIRQGRLIAIERGLVALPAVVRERSDDAYDARVVARGRRDDLRALEAGAALVRLSQALAGVTEEVRAYLRATGDAAVIIRLAAEAPHHEDVDDDNATPATDEGGRP